MELTFTNFETLVGWRDDYIKSIGHPPMISVKKFKGDRVTVKILKF